MDEATRGQWAAALVATVVPPAGALVAGWLALDAPPGPARKALSTMAALQLGTSVIIVALALTPDAPALSRLETTLEFRPGQVAVGQLGVRPGPQSPDVTGVVVGSVESDSPAAHAGLVSSDVILAVDATEVESTAELRGALRDYRPGSTRRLLVQRIDGYDAHHGGRAPRPLATD